MPKDKVLRNILFLSVATVLVLAAYNIFFIFPSFTSLATEVSENDSVRIATHLTNILRSAQTPLTHDSLTDAFRKEAELLRRDFSLMKVLVFSPSGKAIYSSDPGDVGHITEGKFFHDIVAKGRIYKKFVQKGTRSASGQAVMTDVVETYVPIMREGKFLGACEVYMDITGSKAESDKLLLKSFYTLFVLIFGLLTAVLLASSKANKSIMARRRAEEALEESEHLLQKIIETEPECVKLLARDGTLLKMNRAGLEMIEADFLDQAKGKSVYELISPEYREAFRSLTEKTFEGTSGTMEFELVGLKGKRLWLETRAVPIRDAKGKIFASLGITRDITERKMAEEKLKLFSQAVEEATDGIQITDLEGYIIYSNKAVGGIFGFPSNESTGKHVTELAVDKEFADKVILPSIREAGRWNGELMAKDKDGKTFPIWLTTALIKNDTGKPTAMMGIIRDISTRKQAEEEIKRLNQELQRRAGQLAQSYKDLENFSFAASHDLREPLIVVEWFCGNLLKKYADRLDDDGVESLGIIKDKARQMAQLINDLLFFSRLSAEEVVKSDIDMETLAKGVVSGMEAGISDRDVRLRVKEMPNAWGDPSMIRQVLTNLLSNALKYTRTKAVAYIEIGGSEGEAENIYYVKDNGIGFHRDDSARLFGLFQRLQSSQEFEGTGAGLVIVKRIIEKHGGSVRAEGKVGEGATFFFSLPSNGHR